jgi:hypothetical protein
LTGADRIHAAALTLDQVKAATDPARWWWHLAYATFPGPGTAGIAVILSTSVTIDEGPGDWTELELDVSWSRAGAREVTAQLGIACHCDTDHGTHYTRRLVTAAATGSALALAMQDATRSLVIWASEPSSPGYWRAAARLPSKTG